MVAPVVALPGGRTLGGAHKKCIQSNIEPAPQGESTSGGGGVWWVGGVGGVGSPRGSRESGASRESGRESGVRGESGVAAGVGSPGASRESARESGVGRNIFCHLDAGSATSRREYYKGEWLRESGACGSVRVARLPPVRRRTACPASAPPRVVESRCGAGSVCDGMHVGCARRSVLPAWRAPSGASFFRRLNMAGEVASPAAGCVVLCLYAFAQRVKREI
jgi:hypothetical protein